MLLFSNGTDLYTWLYQFNCATSSDLDIFANHFDLALMRVMINKVFCSAFVVTIPYPLLDNNCYTDPGSDQLYVANPGCFGGSCSLVSTCTTSPTQITCVIPSYNGKTTHSTPVCNIISTCYTVYCL